MLEDLEPLFIGSFISHAVIRRRRANNRNMTVLYYTIWQSFVDGGPNIFGKVKQVVKM